MKKFTFCILSTCGIMVSNGLLAQFDTKDINSKLIEAIISPSNAQEIREVQVDLEKGISVLKIKGLSPFLDPNSIQIKSENDIVIQTIKFQLGNNADAKQQDSLKQLKASIKEIESKLLQEKTGIDIINERKEFLKTNYEITMIDNIKPEIFKAMNDMISGNIKSLANELLERNNKIKALTKEKNALKNQILGLTQRSNKAKGEVILKVSALKEGQTKLTVSYITEKAGWTPSYDIKVDKLSKPMSIIYKANVFQNTGSDWTNVKLKFINTQPSSFGNVPELETYYLPPIYKPYKINQSNNNANEKIIQGTILDKSTKEPLVGVSIDLKYANERVSTASDINGNFSLSHIPVGSTLLINYIGYIAKEVTISSENEYLFIELDMDTKTLEEVVVVGYGRPPIVYDEVIDDSPRILSGKGAGVTVQDKKSGLARRTKSVESQSTISSINGYVGTNQTFIEFVVNKPSTIVSSEIEENIELQKVEIPVQYSYIIIPKLEPVAYLNAEILNWSQLNLMSGDANIYFENTFMGKITISTDNFSDTLKISLGKDRNVIAKREKMKEFSKTTFLGSSKTKSLHYKIAVRNNKQEEINIKLNDQIPVSQNNEIEVEKLESSGGEVQKESGKVEWNLKIPAQSTKDLDLKYKVKYPKDSNLNVD